MLGIIIGTHGRFSEELLKTSEMIFGKQENVETVTFEQGEGSEDLVAKYEAAIEKLDREKGILFLVDLFGGSPFNAASRIAINNYNMDILTGVNLPMLLEIYGLRETLSLQEIVSIGENSGKEGIRQFKLGLSNEEEEEL